ncbi:MAG: inositol monophosphatase family protein [Planctomycetaceae bacterium]|nr:inositol monophosphatase family protein [Planctomycetaceae bacterium]
MAAGVLIVQEAGGRITNIDGGRFRLDVPSLLATNGSVIHDRLAGLMS